MSGESMRALEEERRLFYVAITRAEKHCFLTFAKMRFRYGKMEFSQPSRFLRDIDVKYLKPAQEDDLKVRKSQSFGERSFGDESSAPIFSSREKTISLTRKKIFPNYENKMTSQTPVSVPRNLKRVSEAPKSSPSGNSAAPLLVGQLIQHDRFGIGEVKKVEGTGDNAKATIEFRNAGTKQLLLRFARFKVIS